MRKPLIVVILALLIKNTLNLKKMSNVLDGISQDIAKAIEFAAKIADDVKRLDAKIAALPDRTSVV